ncbi:hypothetical protein ACFYRL_27270 [Streptomyces goshikiensis]
MTRTDLTRTDLTRAGPGA